MERQRGQSIVEFALIFPFFLLLLFGIIYTGMLFADYISLNDIARSSAREAAIATAAERSAGYTNIRQRYIDNARPITGLYVWKTSDSSAFSIKQITSNPSSKNEIANSVKVTIRADLDKTFAGVPAFLSEVIGGALPASYTITYSMHDESANGS